MLCALNEDLGRKVWPEKPSALPGTRIVAFSKPCVWLEVQPVSYPCRVSL